MYLVVVLVLKYCGLSCLGDDRLLRPVAGDAHVASERLIFHPRIPTLAETSHRRLWVESTRCGEPADRDEGAKGQSSILTEISVGMRHGAPYVLYGDDFEAAQNSGCRSRLSTESD